MKYILFFLISFYSFKTFSQELNDRIFTKEGDTILCKITKVEKNWIYYDHMGKKSIKNDYVHMSDIKSYIYNGTKKKPYEQEVKTVQLEQKEVPDLSPKDTVKGFYIDSLNNKRSCYILLNKNKNTRSINQYRKVSIIDSLGKLHILYPDKIAGYSTDGSNYRRFKIIFKGKTINFFAKELVAGRALLYLYNGEQMNNEPIYIFKKQTETEFSFVQESLSKKSEFGTTESKKPQAGGSQNAPMSFVDEEPYLNYFQSYLSDCQEVLTKFKSNWYFSYSSVITMFTDYNKCK